MNNKKKLTAHQNSINFKEFKHLKAADNTTAMQAYNKQNMMLDANIVIV